MDIVLSIDRLVAIAHDCFEYWKMTVKQYQRQSNSKYKIGERNWNVNNYVCNGNWNE